MRNHRDAGAADDGAAIVTYSRLPKERGAKRLSDDRVEPVLDAREVPYPRAEPVIERGYADRGLEDFDPDEFSDAPAPRGRRGRGARKGGTGSRLVVLAGIAALLIGGSILAYAYVTATRLDGPTATPLATVPADGTGATGDAAALPAAPDAAIDNFDTTGVRRVPLGASPAAESAAPASAPAGADSANPATASVPPAEAVAPQPPVTPPKPKERPAQIARPAPAAAQPAASANGEPMDGIRIDPNAGEPAIAAPVPTTAAPPAFGTPATTRAPAPAAPAPSASGNTNGGDDLITNIEALLKRDAPAAGQSGQAAPLGEPTPLGATADTLPPGTGQDIGTAATGEPLLPPPPDSVFPQRGMRLPPADIPNAPPSGTAF